MTSLIYSSLISQQPICGRPQVGAIALAHIYRLSLLTPFTSWGSAPHVKNHSHLRLQCAVLNIQQTHVLGKTECVCLCVWKSFIGSVSLSNHCVLWAVEKANGSEVWHLNVTVNRKEVLYLRKSYRNVPISTKHLIDSTFMYLCAVLLSSIHTYGFCLSSFQSSQY